MFKKAKIIYGLIDQTLNEDTHTPLFSSLSPYSKLDNVLLNINKDKLTYLEKNYLLLDGTHKFPGVSRSSFLVGYESNNLSDAAGNVNEYIEFVYTNLHDSYGIQIDFPEDSIVVDFTIQYFNGSSLIKTINVTNNTKTFYSNYEEALKWNRTRITITKIKNPNQRVRINQVVFGVSDTYDEDLLMSITASQNVSLTSSNTDSGQVDVTFYNEGRFNIKDIKDLPEGIQAGVKVNVYFDNELFGTYITQETTVEDEGKSIHLVGYDFLYKYNFTNYIKGKVYPEGRSLYDWAMDVANDAGLKITVDPSFKNIISKGYIGYVPHREALRLIAEAGNGIIISKPDGSVFLEKINLIKFDDITNDDIIESSLDVQDKEKVLGVKVNQYSYSLAKEKIGLAEVRDIALLPEEQTLEIEYAQYPALITDIQYDTLSSIEIISEEYYSDRAIIKYRGNVGDVAWITLLGKPYNTAKTILNRSVSENDVIEINNTLITDKNMAQSVLDYQFKYQYGIYDYSADVILDKEIGLERYTKLDKDSIIITKVEKSISADDISLKIEGVDNPNA